MPWGCSISVMGLLGLRIVVMHRLQELLGVDQHHWHLLIAEQGQQVVLDARIFQISTTECRKRAQSLRDLVRLPPLQRHSSGV